MKLTPARSSTPSSRVFSETTSSIAGSSLNAAAMSRSPLSATSAVLPRTRVSSPRSASRRPSAAERSRPVPHGHALPVREEKEAFSSPAADLAVRLDAGVARPLRTRLNAGLPATKTSSIRRPPPMAVKRSPACPCCCGECQTPARDPNLRSRWPGTDRAGRPARRRAPAATACSSCVLELVAVGHWLQRAEVLAGGHGVGRRTRAVEVSVGIEITCRMRGGHGDDAGAAGTRHQRVTTALPASRRR